MKDQDSATIVTTFLLLLPWLWRGAVSAMEVWQAQKERQTTKETKLRTPDCDTAAKWEYVAKAGQSIEPDKNYYYECMCVK